MSKEKLSRNIGSMSFAVLISRIFGLLRDQIFAYFFGATFVADAFNTAFKIPNLLRRLFGEGALGAAFIPLYQEIGIKHGKKEQIHFALNLLTILLCLLSFLCVISLALTPWIVKIIAPGFNQVTYELTVKLTRIMFPFLILIGFSSMLVSILNSHKLFFIPALTSSFMNVVMIAAMLLPGLLMTKDVSELSVWLSIGVLVGGILQTITLFPLLKKLDYKVSPVFDLKSEAISNLWKKFLPGVIGIAVRQVNLLADQILASLLVVGSISALGYGNRLMQLPFGIIGVSAGAAVIPYFSDYVAKKEWGSLNSKLNFALKTMLFFSIPITLLIVLLGKDIIRILFMRGAFDLAALDMSYSALVYYSVGLIFLCLNRVIIPVFYAHKNTKTPVKISIYIVFINVVLNIILMQFMQHNGLALATSIAAVLQFFILLNVLNKDYEKVKVSILDMELIRFVILNIIAGILVKFIYLFMGSQTMLMAIVRIVLSGIVTLIVFGVGVHLLRIQYGIRLWEKISRKLLRK